MAPTLLQILKLSVVALVFAIGLDSTIADLVYLRRRPGLLLRSLVAMFVLVPLLALILVRLLSLPVGVEVALLVLAVSAGAPLLPRRLMHLGRGSYVFGLLVVSSLLAILTVPAWLAILAPLFDRTSTLTPAEVAPVIARSFLAPLALGMLVGWLAGGWSQRLSEWLMAGAGIVLTASALLLLVTQGSLVLEAGWPALLTLGGTALGALAIGHISGGPDPDDRTALAVSCATRHVGMAVLVAAVVPGPRTAALVSAYLVASASVSIPYVKWRRRRKLE